MVGSLGIEGGREGCGDEEEEEQDDEMCCWVGSFLHKSR